MTMELGVCMPASEGSPDYVMWDVAKDMGLQRFDYATDSTCAEGSSLEGNT